VLDSLFQICFDFLESRGYNRGSLDRPTDTAHAALTFLPASKYAGSFWEVQVYAIVVCGGRQYRAEEGFSFAVEKLPYEVGDSIELDKVLLVADGEEVTVGQPTVDNASVTATIVEQYRGKKILIWKYRPSKRYRLKKGHRQSYTRLRIDSVNFG